MKSNFVASITSVRAVHENGLFDAGHDLTLIVMIDRRVGLSLSHGRVYGGEFFSAVLNSWVAWLREIIPL